VLLRFLKTFLSFFALFVCEFDLSRRNILKLTGRVNKPFNARERLIQPVIDLPGITGF